jgi:hypothetical protein
VVSWHALPSLLDALAQAVAPGVPPGAHVLVTAPDPGPDTPPEDVMFLREVAEGSRATRRAPEPVDRLAGRHPHPDRRRRAADLARRGARRARRGRVPRRAGDRRDPALTAAAEELGARLTVRRPRAGTLLDLLAEVVETVADHELSTTSPRRGVGRREPRAAVKVVVIGGGLTGLATAWHLRDVAEGPPEVSCSRPPTRLGGEIRTVDFAGRPTDLGADAFLARQPEAEHLARALGLGDDLVAPAASQVHVWVVGRLRPLPSGTVLGAPPTSPRSHGPGCSRPAGVARAAIEPLLPRRRVVGDRSVADLVGERFGREVVDRPRRALLGGVYAGAADRLSARSAAAPIWAAASAHRSVTAGIARAPGTDRRRHAADLPHRPWGAQPPRRGARGAARGPPRHRRRGPPVVSTAAGRSSRPGPVLQADAVVLAVPAVAAGAARPPRPRGRP